jgi:dsDNA-specific endonuclease/ATPase MutS2
MPFPVGSSVVVLPLGKKRGVVVEVGRSGHYRVRVESAMVSCREDDLVALPEEPRKKRARREPPSLPALGDSRTAPAPAPAGRVDLHGLTVDEAIARVVEAIDAALRLGADRLEVIHGKGSGRIRQALHRHLETMTVVASFSLDPRNPGVTWVYF